MNRKQVLISKQCISCIFALFVLLSVSNIFVQTLDVIPCCRDIERIIRRPFLASGCGSSDSDDEELAGITLVITESLSISLKIYTHQAEQIKEFD
jgi:hypothetical protein